MTPLDNALNRMAELRAELAELEVFVRVYYRMYPQEKLASMLPDGPKISGVDKSVYNSADKIVPKEAYDAAYASAKRAEIAARHKPKRHTEDLMDRVEDIVRASDRPMTRGEILERIEKMEDAPPLPDGGDKTKYLGTLLWRNRDRFKNLPGYGYWIRELPFPAANYDPATDAEADQLLDSEAAFVEKDLAKPMTEPPKVSDHLRDRLSDIPRPPWVPQPLPGVIEPFKPEEN